MSECVSWTRDLTPQQVKWFRLRGCSLPLRGEANPPEVTLALDSIPPNERRAWDSGDVVAGALFPAPLSADPGSRKGFVERYR